MPGPVRVRDLRDNIKTYGFEKGTVTTMEALLEENIAMRQAVVSLTKMVDGLIDQFGTVLAGTDVMRKQLESLRRADEQFHDLKGKKLDG